MNYIIGSVEHERAIVEAYTQATQGVGELKVPEGDPLYKKVTTAFREIMKDWPKAPRSGSRFVGCYCTVYPMLVFDLVPRNNDPVFLNLIKREVDYGPLTHEKYGNFTFEEGTLTIQNIRLNALHRTNQPNASSVAVVNNKEPIYHVNVAQGPAMLKAQGVADASFKGLLSPGDTPIEVEQRQGAPVIKISIPTSLCGYRGKIRYDGQVVLSEKVFSDGTSSPLENGSSFDIHDFIGTHKQRRIAFPCRIDVPFRGAVRND